MNARRLFTGLPLIVLLCLSYYAKPVKAHFNPKQGRWLQRDPIGTGPRVAMAEVPGPTPVISGLVPSSRQYGDGMNLYEYVRSAPIRFDDPFGLQASNPIGGGAGGGTAIARAVAKVTKAIKKLKNIDCKKVNTALGAASRAVDELEDLLEILGAATYKANTARLFLEGAKLANRVRCQKPCKSGKKCKACEPGFGTLMHQVHKVPPSRPHGKFKGSHTHYFVVLQSPPSAGCKCFTQRFWTLESGVPLPGLKPRVDPKGGGVAK